jgi:hypothetical protein
MPRDLRYPESSKQEVIHRKLHPDSGQFFWPRSGRSTDRHRAHFMTATGRVPLTVDTNGVLRREGIPELRGNRHIRLTSRQQRASFQLPAAMAPFA